MNIYDYPAFAEILSGSKPIVFLCGAGLSISLSNSAKGWVNWLRASADFMPADYSIAGHASTYSETLEDRFGSFTAPELVDAAGFALDALKGNGSYTTFMDSTIGRLRIDNRELSDALGLLARSGDIFATTNYDSLLEKATGQDYLTYNSPGKIMQMLGSSGQAGLRNSVIHLHGVYDPVTGMNDIVADQTQYEDILRNQGAQFIQNLISTHTLVIIGCGATVDDPNLSGFLSFAGQQLGLNVPYFYLHRAGDDVSSLAGNVTAACYGSQYSDLTDAIRGIANFRIRTRYKNEGVVKVNPYIETQKSASAAFRLHYLDGFSSFIGREKELDALNQFCEADGNLLWWAVTGEGGIGKSRLTYEWLKRLPNDWLGFFASSDANPELYLKISPFSNTVIVFDYIVGHEASIAHILTALRQRFEYEKYKLRIVMIERRCDADKYNWADDVFNRMDMQDRIAFDNAMYKAPTAAGNKDANSGNIGSEKSVGLVPLQINALSRDEELAVIESYMGAYLEKVADDSARSKYPGAGRSISDFAADILAGFHKALSDEYSRPLFLAIYTELWIYKDGAVEVEGINGILEAFFHKEEDGWRTCLGNDNVLLNDYVKLLALAAATGLTCLDDEQGFYQSANDNLNAFIESNRNPGKKQRDYSDLFIRQEYAHDYSSVHNSRIKSDEDIAVTQEEILRISRDDRYISLDEHGQPKLLTIIEPRYPDIILEFLVDYYIPEHEWVPFAQSARMGSVMQFEMFLSRACEDFPEFRSYMEMAFAPVEDEADRLGKTLFYMLSVEKIVDGGRVGQVADDLCTSNADASVLPFEMESWRRLGVVLTSSRDMNRLYDTGLRSAEYIADRCGQDHVKYGSPEVMQSFLIGLHNAEQTSRMADLLEKYEAALADSLDDDDGVVGCFIENYINLSVLWMRAKDRKKVCGCWEKLMGLWERFPLDTDNLEMIAKSTENFYDYYNENNIPGRRIRLVRDLERIFDETKKAGVPNKDMANALAVHEANEHSLNYKQLGMAPKLETRFFGSDAPLAGVLAPIGTTDADARARMKNAEQRLDEIYGMFPDEEEVVLGYACLLDFRNTFGRTWHAKIDDSVLRLFQDWIVRYPTKALQLNEFYAQVLLEKWMDACDFGNRQEVNRLYSELVGIANKLDKQFPDVENEVRGILNSGLVRRM